MSLSIVRLAFCIAASAYPQSSAAPDTILFTNGEQLTGQLQRATTDEVIFKSAMVGVSHLKWTNIKELHSAQRFALLTAGEKLTRKNAADKVVQGTVAFADGNLSIASKTSQQSFPVAKTAALIDVAEFENALNHPPNLLHRWAGLATGGVSLVRATQNSTTFNGSINLVRATPQVVWLAPRSKTAIDYNQAYGTVSQPATPTLKTNIFHADAERDDYFSPRVYIFESVTFDHNFSQSLDLQQAYGGGIGITLLQNAQRTLDFKGDAHYEKQRFFDTTQNQNLFGSTFSEKYLRYLAKGLIFNEYGTHKRQPWFPGLQRFWFQSCSSR